MSKKRPPGEPYQPPSADEVHESGTADWVDGALEVHERKQQKLSSMMESAREALREQQESIQQMWSTSGTGAKSIPKQELPSAPDVFAKERAANSQKQAKLSSMFDDGLQARAEEEDQLRNFFGGGSKKPRR
jgi:hypothetical protein